jgi:hypothetical protein
MTLINTTDDKKQYRIVPQGELDFNMMVINTVWGDTNIPEGLKDKLTKYTYVLDKNNNIAKDDKGEPIINKDALWELLGFYTRDMRLGNIRDKFQLVYCQYYLDLANDLLREDYIIPFCICISRAATVLELSQSWQGFLREKLTTIRSENVNTNIEPPKKNFFGAKQ